LTLKSANSERSRINTDLLLTLKEETSKWGIDIVRMKLREIDPPEDVQDTMNKNVEYGRYWGLRIYSARYE